MGLSDFIGPLFGAAGSIANIVAPGVGGAVAGVLGDAISSGFNQMNNNTAIDKYNQGQLELAKYVADRNEGFWNLQNEYNTPKKQMQRYIDAGLNPNLIYGQINNGNASAVQAFQMPPQERKQYRAAINSALGIQLQNAAADTKVKEAQARKLNADADLSSSRQAGQDITNTISSYLIGPSKLKYEAIMSAAGIYEDAVISEFETKISKRDASIKANQILNIQALTAEYLYSHGDPELKIQAQRALVSIRANEARLKKNMADWSDMGINPAVDGFLIRQVGNILKNHDFNSIEDAVSYVLDYYLK